MFVYESGNANFDLCAIPCDPPAAPPVGTCPDGSLMWVQQDSSLKYPPNPPAPCSDSAPLQAAARVSATEAVMAGAFGRILRYDADGVPNNITDQASTYFTRLNDGEFTNGLQGCVIGQGRIIMRTTDGGVTWNDVSNWSCNGGAQGNGIDFSSTGGYGVAVGDGGFMAHSDNWGAMWAEVQAPPTSASLQAVAFVPEGILPTGATTFAVGKAGMSDGVVLRSFDQGVTWDPPTSFVGVPLNGVAFATPLVGYVVGDGQAVFRTRDGGTHWTPIDVANGSGENFLDIETWGDGSDAILVGQGGAVYERTAGGPFIKQTLLDAGGQPVVVSESLNDVAVLNDGAYVRVCGDNGVVLFRDSGSWARLRSWTNHPLYKVSFQGPNQGYAIGRNFVILDCTPEQ